MAAFVRHGAYTWTVASWLDRGFARRPALRYRIEAPLRRPWHVLIPAALVLAAAVTLGLLLPPRYRAAAFILGEWDKTDEAALQRHGIDVAERRGQTVRERIRDRGSIERMLQRPELGPRDQAPRRDEVAKWLDAVQVQPQGANAFRIECVLPDATRAALVANLVATDLIEQAQADAVEAGSAQPQLLAAQLAEARGLVEKRQAAFQRVQLTPPALEPSASRPSSPPPRTPLPQEERLRLASEYEEARSAYEALLEQWQAAEAAARLSRGTTVRFELLRRATVPDGRESPGLFALAGGALGLVLGLAVALLAEMRDHTVKGPEDLAALLPLPLLATIPLVRKGVSRATEHELRAGGLAGRRGRDPGRASG